jgi:hypothetical protein
VAGNGDRVTAVTPVASWSSLRTEYNKMGQMGYQTVEQAAKVGGMLLALKESTPHGKFRTRAESELPDVSADTVGRLMKIAQHWPQIAPKKPDSLRAALALIPSKPREPKGNDDDQPEPHPVGQDTELPPPQCPMPTFEQELDGFVIHAKVAADFYGRFKTRRITKGLRDSKYDTKLFAQQMENFIVHLNQLVKEIRAA